MTSTPFSSASTASPDSTATPPHDTATQNAPCWKDRFPVTVDSPRAQTGSPHCLSSRTSVAGPSTMIAMRPASRAAKATFAPHAAYGGGRGTVHHQHVARTQLAQGVVHARGVRAMAAHRHCGSGDPHIPGDHPPNCGIHEPHLAEMSDRRRFRLTDASRRAGSIAHGRSCRTNTAALLTDWPASSPHSRGPAEPVVGRSASAGADAGFLLPQPPLLSRF